MKMMRPLENARRRVAKRPLTCLRLKCENDRFASSKFENLRVEGGRSPVLL